ncbi:MAG: DUF4384 domain-containing protein [Treponema sp.]|nr:DUF4384 domain-containing protein [Treponema sp.]
MKKLIAIISLFISLIATNVFAKDISFDDLLNQAATEVSAEIEETVNSIAILDVQTEYWAVSDYIVDELAHYFTRRFGNGNVIAHDEYTRSLIENELKYQQSGFVSDETIQEIGRELGVDCVIIGEFSEISSGWQLYIKATHVETKKILFSWKGKVKKNDKEVKFQVSKSKKNPKPKLETNTLSPQKNSDNNHLGISLCMINQNDETTNVVHPKDVIRFKVSSVKNAYLAILCIDVNNEEEWLPLENNFIRAGESRIFPDKQGITLYVQDGFFGNEKVVVYAASSENELPQQKNFIETGTRKFAIANENSEVVTAEINYRVEK